MQTISIQGFQGSFHDIVRRQYYPDSKVLERATFKEVFEDLREDRAQLGIIAIENTVAGSILENYDLLLHYKYPIVADTNIRIIQNLMALKGETIESIKEVHSHPMAIKQCAQYLDALEVKIVETADTALSAREISERGLKGIAAIASTQAAELYNLEMLADSIETNKQNYTRFLVVSPTPMKNNNPTKASIALMLKHEPGSLAKIINTITKYNLNMTKIESRPIIGEPFNYRFFIDYEADNLGDIHEEVIKALKPNTQELEVLGVYESI